jgi:hypothetical protein
MRIDNRDQAYLSQLWVDKNVTNVNRGGYLFCISQPLRRSEDHLQGIMGVYLTILSIKCEFINLATAI